MKTALTAILMAILLVGCSTTSTPNSRPHVIRGARITWYDNHEDKWGSKVACGGHAREGVTVAAHSDFPFGQQLRIPALAPIFGHDSFVVQDRGGAVQRRKAATHGEYVFDVYLWAKNKRTGLKRIRQMGSALQHADVYLE